ncbi:deoxynucleoside kinase [Mycoplasmopsis sturni]|uniref:deoxynucleoside kinase n=1 Tax=Mycoplasmopsis sturni TaxID=39047 RepID=UPI0005643498|nr:deoxynucleoside kinase [Mycoplasmopsis sturni]
MIVAISGMISSGKTSVVKYLNDFYQEQSLILTEYKEDDEIFEYLLNAFLNQTPNSTLAFDTYIIDSHIERFLEQKRKLERENKKYLFLDRFPLEHTIFAEIDFEDRNKEEREAYQHIVTELSIEESLPDLAIFLDLNFETFKSRIQKRNRKAEMDHFEESLNYWFKLHNIYKNKFIELCQKFNINYVIVDTNNLTSDQVAKEVNNIIVAKENNENSN